MKYSAMFFVPLCVGIITPLIFEIVKKEILKKESSMKSNDFIVANSVAWGIFSLLLTLFILIVWLLLVFSDASNVACDIIMPIFIITFLLLSYVVIRQKVYVKNDIITVTPAFGKTVKLDFTNITKIKKIHFSNGTIVYKIYSDKCVFSIDSLTTGTNLFITQSEKNNIVFEEL